MNADTHFSLFNSFHYSEHNIRLKFKKKKKFLISVLSLILWFVIPSNIVSAGQGFSRAFAEDVTPEEKGDNSRSFHSKCCGVLTKTYDDSKLSGENKWLGASREDWVIYESQTMRRSEAQERWSQKQEKVREDLEKCKFSYDPVNYKWKYDYRDLEEWRSNTLSERYDSEKVRKLEGLQSQADKSRERERQDTIEREDRIAAAKERQREEKQKRLRELEKELERELSIKGMSLSTFKALYPERARYYSEIL